MQSTFPGTEAADLRSSESNTVLCHGCTLSAEKERDFWQKMPEVSFFIAGN